jgi:hypothetical protein
MRPRALVVGAGWYGCYAALVLQRLGCRVDVIDEADRFFAGSSSKNQNRLHLGFHYPRSYWTRIESFAGYQRFVAEFPELCKDVTYNAYLVSADSSVDLQTYLHVFQHEGYEVEVASVADFENASGMSLDRSKVQGDSVVYTREKYIDHGAAGAHFENRLGHLLLPYDASALDLSDPDQPAYGGARYDLAIDCTYGQQQLSGVLREDLAYEACCSLVYRRLTGPRDFALTVMDGPFFSIYPYDIQEGLFTLTHVAHTPMMASPDVAEVKAFCADVSEDDIARVREKMVVDVLSYVPEFRDAFEYAGYFMSVKAKQRRACRSDDRSLQVRVEGRVLSFCGGKITGIFGMETHLESMVHRVISKAPPLTDPTAATCRAALRE